MFSVRDVFAVSIRNPQAYMSHSSQVNCSTLRAQKNLLMRINFFLIEGLIGAYAIEKGYPCGEDSQTFKFLGWVCLEALIFAATLMIMISEVCHPFKTAPKTFLKRSLSIGACGFGLTGAVLLTLY